MFYKVEYQKRAHQEVEKIFRVLLPEQGLAVREEQIRLCHEMLDTLLGERIALCDAGVGIGKTYAYLVACVLMRKYSILMERNSLPKQHPVVVSTSSIALQKAILSEYVPFLSRVLVEQGIIQTPLRAVVRKGKEHFVCDNRLEQRIEAIRYKQKNAVQREALLSLRKHYDMDIVKDLSGFDRRLVCVPKFCPRECPGRQMCRYQRYLEESKKQDVFLQICNHNYLLADAFHRREEYKPLLADYRALVVDEAHKLPEAARQMFGKNLCMDDIREIAYYLEREHQNVEARTLKTGMYSIFTIIRESHMFSHGIKENFQLTGECEFCLWEGIQMIERMMEQLKGVVPKWVLNRLQEAKEVLECFLQKNSKYVLHLRMDKEKIPVLCAASREIPQLLREMLWDREQALSVILTSGTLKAGKGFARTLQMTGLEGRTDVQSYVAESPFAYEENCLLYLPKTLRKCKRGSREEVEMVAGQIHSLICSTYGHTLVLFTSYGTFRYQMLKYCEKYQIADGEYLFKSHDYRHNLATLYYDSGISLQAVRDYLGHEYEEMTRQYVDYMPKKLEKASEAYFQEETHSFAAELMKGEFHG